MTCAYSRHIPANKHHRFVIVLTLDFESHQIIIITALLRAREGMGPVISRQPHQVVKVPIPTGISHSPADEVLCLSARGRGAFFMADYTIRSIFIYQEKRK